MNRAPANPDLGKYFAFLSVTALSSFSVFSYSNLFDYKILLFITYLRKIM
jgi:hypothetical protein